MKVLKIGHSHFFSNKDKEKHPVMLNAIKNRGQRGGEVTSIEKRYTMPTIVLMRFEMG